ncbi:MAG TPA: helix-turn-helix domain-containing protein, partial [Candidatus Limnocylindria bacterium]|nr:helix-turn-helix domain-containing protein [Candidatus Limnocylindria bacterium]
MTTRHQYRLANRRLGRDRAPIDAAPAPRLGEMLQLARERKGVDLFRAERDTKIRLRYLAALEDSDFDELPAAVYTKGFLRNYAIYLGLDPNEALERWRAEMEAARSGEKMVVAPPPQPLASPRQMINLSPGMLVTAVVLIAIVTFVGYVALQLMRYTDVPAIELTNPAARVSTIDADSVELSGTTVAGALISIHAPGDQLLQATANENGAWSHEVPLARGRNDFSIVALDPVTQRESEPYFVIITVPLPIETPG